MNQNMSLFYGLESLLGVIGLYPFIVNLLKLESPNALETKIKNIFLNLATLLLIRFPYQAFNNPLSKRLTYALATILILNVFLYFETLLRKHMPLQMKISVSFFVIIFLIDTLFLDFINNQMHLVALGAIALLIMTGIVSVALLRKRTEYTRSENSLINISLISLVFLVLFLLSDAPFFYQLLRLPHLGVLGILLFTYASFHDQTLMTNNYNFLKKILKSIILSLFSLFTLSTLLPTVDNNIAVHAFVLLMNIILVIRIHFQAKELSDSNSFYSFIEHLVESDKTSLKAFLNDIYQFFNKLETKSIGELELKNYNINNFNNYFNKSKTHLISIIDLRNTLLQKNEDLEIVEQMIDLLEGLEMSHLFRVSEKHSKYITFNFYMIGQSNIIYSQTALISEVSKIFDKDI